MCLLTKQICPIKARKPIVVYKLLWMDDAKNNSFLTPWTYTRTGLNKHLVAEGKEKDILQFFKTLRTISRGYIHCYTKIKFAECGKYFMPYNAVYKKVIVKCIIEPGTRYYKSWDGEEIAADTVFIKEIIES